MKQFHTLTLTLTLTLVLIFSASIEVSGQERMQFPPAVAALRELIGHDTTDSRVGTFLRILGSDYEVTRTPFGRRWCSWKSKGLTCCFDAEVLTEISLQAASGDGFHQYPGELPEALSFSNTREEVELKLASPRERTEDLRAQLTVENYIPGIAGGDSTMTYEMTFPASKLRIKYSSTSLSVHDMKAKIDAITLITATEQEK